MIQSIYLHSHIVNTLRTFGNLSEVINRILQAGADGKIELTDRPPCINRAGASRYNIDITQPEYLELLNYYPLNSPKVSIRRIIYWFVDFEIYNQLNWKPQNKYVDKDLQLLCSHINKARNSIERIELVKKDNEEVIAMTKSINDLLVKLEEYLKNGGEYN